MADNHEKEIWVVEGNPRIRRGVSELLTKEGYSVTQLKGVISAQKLLAAGAKPPCILTGLEMYKASGTELILYAQAAHPEKKIEFVLMCSDSDLENIASRLNVFSLSKTETGLPDSKSLYEKVKVAYNGSLGK